MGMFFLLPLHLLLLLSQLLSLPLPVNPTVSVVAPVAADTAFDDTFDIATLIATYTGADVTVVGNIIIHTKQSCFFCSYVCFCTGHPFRANAALSGIILIKFYFYLLLPPLQR